MFVELHAVSVKWIYTEPTTDYNIMGGMTGQELIKAQELTESDNRFLDMFKGDKKATEADIRKRWKDLKTMKIVMTKN